jgi:hypothetical protein
MTAPDPIRPAVVASGPPGRPARQAIRLDISRMTLRGYSPDERHQFAQAIAARLAGRGAPEAAAWRAATAILAAVDAELGQRR